MIPNNNTKQLHSQLPPPPIRKPKRGVTSYKYHYLNVDKTSKNGNTPKSNDIPPLSRKQRRSISIEEPIPNSCPNSPNITTTLHRDNIPIGLPSTPSPFHSLSENAFGLETVSEIKEDKSHSIAPPGYISVDISTVSNASYTTTSAVQYSPTSSYQDSRYQPSTLSSTNRSLSTSVVNSDSSTEDHNGIQSFSKMMMQCPTDNDAVSHNTPNNTHNTHNNDNKDDDDNNDDDDTHNERSDECASGGDDGDDGKKKKNDKDMDDNEEEDDDEEEKKEEEDDEEKKEEDIVKTSTWSEFNKGCASSLNGDAAVFKPRRSRSASILLTIDEHAVLQSGSKSAPSCVHHGNNQYGYNPNRTHGYIKISKILTQKVIPKRIKESIVNIYDFMHKCTVIARYNGSECNIGNIKILNYGFHDKMSNECLYLVAEKQMEKRAYYRIHEYMMREEMFTMNEICDIYNITQDILPKPIWSDLMDNLDKMNALFKDPAGLCQKVIFKTKWHKLPVFNAMNNNKQYNKQRLTFAMTKTELINIVQRFVHNENNNKTLLPIVMFNYRGYRMEYVQRVQIRNDICIGISYIYDAKQNTIKATGIHLNKYNILQQHQLTSPNHDYHCLDGFQSDIDNLHIGNPDDDKNRVNALKKKNDDLKHENNNLKKKNEALEYKVNGLEDKIDQLHCVIKQLKDRGRNNSSIISNSYHSTLPSMSPIYNSSLSFSGSNSLLLNNICVLPPTPITCTPIVYNGNNQNPVPMICNNYNVLQ